MFEDLEAFYNRERLHSSLGYVSPATFESRQPAHTVNNSWGSPLAALVGGSAPEGDAVPLTEREEVVTRLIAWGHTNKETTRRLDIGTKSVETYKARVLKKLGLHTRFDPARHAVARGVSGSGGGRRSRVDGSAGANPRFFRVPARG